jgi:autotransporter translocation and assembly factor TamB
VSQQRKWLTWVRRIAIGLGALVVVAVIVAVIVVRVYFNGDRLAAFVTSTVNERIRGKLEIGSINWPLGDVVTVVTGSWMDVEIRNAKVYDFAGDLVLDAPFARAKISASALAFDRDFVIKDIALPEGGWALIKEEVEPYPNDEHDITVVTLVSAFYPKNRPPAPEHPESLARKSSWDLQSFSVDHATIEFEFPNFTGMVEGVRGSGWLYYAKDYGFIDQATTFTYELRDVWADTGTLTITGAEPIELAQCGRLEGCVHMPSLAKREDGVSKQQDESRDLRWEANAITSEGALISTTGAMLNYWFNLDGGDYDIDVWVTNAGALAERMTSGIARGDAMELHATVSGNRWSPDYRVTVANADAVVEPMADKPPLAFHVDTATATYSAATRTGELLDTALTGAGGRVELGASFDVDKQSFEVDVAIPDALALSPWLDREVTRLAGGASLRGSLRVRSIDAGVRVDKLNVGLGKTRFRGAVEYRGDKLYTDDFRAEQDGTWAKSHSGYVDLANRTIQLGISFGSDNLRPLLRRNRKPLIARRAEGSARISGTFDAPQVPQASVRLAGVPVIGKASAKLRYLGGVLHLDEAHSEPFGGELTASGKLEMTGRKPRIIDLRAGGIGFDLSAVPGMENQLSGVARVHASAHGSLEHPVSTVVAEVDDLRVAGDDYANLLLNGATDADGSATVQFHVDRKRGGRLDINGTLTRDGGLGGIVSMREIPIHSLPGVAKAAGRSEFGGIADAELQLGGTIESPTADGYVSATRAWFKQTFLGAAEVSFESIGPGALRVSGGMFQGKFTIDGTVRTWPNPSAELDLAFRRIELDQFFPELAAKHDLRGWMSGRFETLTLAPGQQPTFTLHLTELVVLMENEDERGRPNPIKARATSDVVVKYDGVKAALLQPAVFQGPTGEFTVTGTADPEALALSLDGTIDVALLQPYLHDVFEEARGTVTATVDVTGSPATPRVTGILEIDSVTLRPIGQDAVVRVPLAKVQVTNDAIIFTGFRVEVIDEITGDEPDILEVSGAVGMRNFVPRSWGLHVGGELSGKLLLVIAPDTFTAAGGSAFLELDFLGVSEIPDISGKLSFDAEDPLTFTPRGLRREILINTGEVAFDDRDVELIELGGTVDDSGLLVDLSGELSLEDWAPADLDISLVAEGIPFRVPQVLELELDIRSFRVVGDLSGLEVFGQLDIIDGRYVQKFNPLLTALRPERVRESERPFYEEVELISRAQLDLRVTTGGGFGIKNNIADIDLDGEVRVRGTPVRPQVDGEIQVKQGSFKFQGMRARFDHTEGNIVFSRFKRFPDDSPTVEIRSESAYLDTRGNEHNVVLVLSGSLSNLNWDLFTTNTGLDKSQTFTLLFAGRTTEDTRSLLGDEAIGGGTFDSKSTAETEGSLHLFDQLAKDYLGDFISVLVEDPLRNVTGIDIVRIEVGTSGIGGRVEERIGNNSRAVAEFERTLNGYTLSARGEHRVTDRFSVEAEYLLKQFFDDTDEDVNAGRFKGVFRGKVGE